MKKIIILILLLFSLTACSGNKNFTVTFETNGGKSIEKMTVSRGSIIKNLDIPTKDYHIFKGWYFDSEFEQAFLNSFLVDADIVLYARWQPVQYSIRFNGSGGLFNGEDNITISKPFGETIELPTPSREGYTFIGWFETGYKIRFESTTMPAEDMSLSLNRDHYPQVYLEADYSYGKDDGKGGMVLYTEEELKLKRLKNLTTFEEIFRGNTTFDYKLVNNYETGNLVLMPTYTGYTYSKVSADYIEKHNLATVQKGIGDWWVLEDVSPELINGYGVHLNCDNSPLTNNPFMSNQDYLSLLSYYPISKIETGINLRQLKAYSWSELISVYRILYTSHAQKSENIPVVDENGNPIIRGGYHEFDKDGHFLYDKNGKPIQKLYKYEPKDDGKPIYSKDLVAGWAGPL